MLSIDSLEARRQRMNQGGPFDTAGNRSRYDQTMERGQQIAQQQNDIGMRERMQGRDLLTKLTMQGNDIDSRYGLAAQEAKARERQAAQQFGHTMAALNAEFGFKAGEAGKERSHVKSMADFEAQLREIAASKDFQRGLERLSIEYGMSKEEAATAFDRMLQGKQVDFENQQSRDQSLHGFGQQDLRLQSQLGEQAAQSQFGRDEQMAGVRSRYDLLGQEQKFGFDKTLSDMETDRQFGYLDRQNKLAVDLNEQKFTQSQKLAQQQINDAFNEQFDMGLAEVRGKAGNLTLAGDELLKKIEAKVATLDASSEIMDERWQKSAKDEIVGLMKQMGNPRLLKPSTFKRGDKEFTEDKKGDWIEVNKKPTIMPLGPEHAQYGWVAVDDGRVTVSGQPQRNTAQSSSSDSYLDDMRAIGEIAGKAQKPALDANGRQILGVDGKPVYVPVTWDEAERLFDSRRSTGQGQGQLGGMNQLPKAVGGMNPAMGAGAAMAPGAQMPPQQPGMMQRGPQAQPPRPQNMMQGIPPQQLQDIRKLVAAHAAAQQQSGLSEDEYIKQLPPQDQQQLMRAMQLAQ